MGLLKHFRSRSKLAKEHEKASKASKSSNGAVYFPRVGGSNRDYISRLPPNVLTRIFGYVCPHTADRSYEISELAPVNTDTCMLCDLRDLSHCSQTRRDWYRPAQQLLYSSIRIDAVHYCDLEEIFSDKRKRKSKHGELEDVPATRLRLLANSLRDNNWLASLVLFIKLPYMTRETCKQDLARAVGNCPNLRYADLPAGFYNGSSDCHTLRQELLARCPDIRKMRFESGAEQFIQYLTQRHWQAIQSLELKKLKVEPTMFRQVLGCLPVLEELHVSNVSTFTDVIFNISPVVPNFPALHTLKLERCHGITAVGLVHYLERPETREVLETLSLTNTGLDITQLAHVLWSGTHLKDVTVIATVSHSLPLDPLPPLGSQSLLNLRFEITPTEEYLHTNLPKPSDSYYSYLASSLLSNSLPALQCLYVRDPAFPDTILLAPPAPKFTGQSQHRGFTQPLEIYTKGLDDAEWVFNALAPEEQFAPGFGGNGRPLSTYSINGGGGGGGWGNEARRSVMVGNGVGGFLAVPAGGGDDYGRPTSSQSMKGPVNDWSQRPMSYARPVTSHRPGSSHAVANALKATGGAGNRDSWWGGPKTHQRNGSTASNRGDLWR
ncbi:hypothetical protein Vi05172_g4926 [Venturia inaequalis]|nr:hypothetical protein Vi05172_g4926 [Venturia inaequalis]